MNKVILTGRLTKDPEVRWSQAAEPVAVTRYTLAVNRRFRREGEPDADFINCVVFGKAAEFAEKYFKKGLMVAVAGRLQVRSWDDQSGQRRWSTEVVVEEQDFGESRSSFESRGSFDSAPQQSSKPSAPPADYGSEGFSAITESIDDDDLPF